MTTEEAICQARKHRRPGPPSRLTEDDIEQVLTGLLEVVLQSADTVAHPESPAAFVARCLAAAVANLQDQRHSLN